MSGVDGYLIPAVNKVFESFSHSPVFSPGLWPCYNETKESLPCVLSSTTFLSKSAQNKQKQTGPITISQFAQIVTDQWSEERASFTSFAMDRIATNTQRWATIKKKKIFFTE